MASPDAAAGSTMRPAGDAPVKDTSAGAVCVHPAPGRILVGLL